MGPFTNLRKTLSGEAGQVLVIAALGMTVILGFVGLATDIGILFRLRQSAQSAADSAANTGIQELYFGDVVSAAKADAALNGYTDGANGVTVAVNNPPVRGPHAGDSNFVEVIIDRTQSTIFMGLFNKKTMSVEARAVGGRVPMANCAYALGTSGTDISVSNGANVQFPSCALYGNSTSSSDLSVTGGASLSAAAINLVGNYSVNNGGSTSITPTTGVMAASDPLSYLTPPTFSPSSCVADPIGGRWGTNGRYTIGPASSGGTVCYNGLNISNGVTATLNPGLYIINGALQFGGGSPITGSGVTFYLPSTAPSMNIGNGITATLSAPTSGTYNGILFFQDRLNTSQETFQGGATLNLRGIMYFPKANLTFNNGSNTNTYATIISNSLTFAGGTLVKNYALVNSGTPLSTPRLVE